jgi:hypothetical protein
MFSAGMTTGQKLMSRDRTFASCLVSSLPLLMLGAFREYVFIVSVYNRLWFGGLSHNCKQKDDWNYVVTIFLVMMLAKLLDSVFLMFRYYAVAFLVAACTSL